MLRLEDLGAWSVRKKMTGWGDARHWLGVSLVACMALECAGAASSALARSRHYYDDNGPRREKAASESAPPTGPLFFVISTNKQHVSVYGSNGLYEVSPVSTGRPDHPTPHGIFSIIGKERFHRSNLYSGAPMSRPPLSLLAPSATALDPLGGLLVGAASASLYGPARSICRCAQRWMPSLRGLTVFMIAVARPMSSAEADTVRSCKRRGRSSSGESIATRRRSMRLCWRWRCSLGGSSCRSGR